MPFGLKNTGATYQLAMNYIFQDLIGECLEVYIDDVVVKSQTFGQHLKDLERAFARMRPYELKLNPLKWTFAITRGNFLGFTVHESGIKIEQGKADIILWARSPSNKKELQQLIGKVNFRRRFIANLSGKMRPLSPLLKKKDNELFEWTAEHQEAFESIKSS